MEIRNRIRSDALLERAINFIEGLTAHPILSSDDREMILDDVQEHARIELKSLRAAIGVKGAETDADEIAKLRAALEPFSFMRSDVKIERFDEDNQAWVSIDGAGSDRLGFFVRDILRARAALSTPHTPTGE